MPAARTPRRNGPYAPLSAFYAEDDAVIALEQAGNDLAELLFLRALAYCAREPKLNGTVSRIKLTRIFNRPAAKLNRAAQALVEVGLWEQDDDGWRIRQWQKWNRTAEEVAFAREADRLRKAEEAARNAELSERNPELSAHQSISVQSTALHVISNHDSPSAASAPDVTDHQLSELVTAVRRVRPEWQAALIKNAVRKLVAKSGSLHRSTLALLFVAAAGDTRAPHRALEDGWWWCETDSRYQAALAQLEEAKAV